MRSLGFDMTKAEVLKTLRDHDESGDGLMDFENFAKNQYLFDKDGTGKISLRDLRRVAKEINDRMDDDELQLMIEEFDLDQDGEINEQEFLAIMARQPE
ncbi:hypothetical protein B0H14DRAFT_2827778 [Mycena olivaceomarginata]|nr:hypothetical protein B0H14DRAFT_2827778 [Mycena olivaceomarginata]